MLQIDYSFPLSLFPTISFGSFPIERWAVAIAVVAVVNFSHFVGLSFASNCTPIHLFNFWLTVNQALVTLLKFDLLLTHADQPSK